MPTVENSNARESVPRRRGGLCAEDQRGELFTNWITQSRPISRLDSVGISVGELNKTLHHKVEGPLARTVHCDILRFDPDS